MPINTIENVLVILSNSITDSITSTTGNKTRIRKIY